MARTLFLSPEGDTLWWRWRRKSVSHSLVMWRPRFARPNLFQRGSRGLWRIPPFSKHHSRVLISHGKTQGSLRSSLFTTLFVNCARTSAPDVSLLTIATEGTFTTIAASNHLHSSNHDILHRFDARLMKVLGLNSQHWSMETTQHTSRSIWRTRNIE